MDFQLLGPVIARHDGQLVALGRRRERLLLGLLLLEVGSPVDTARLVDLMWDGRTAGAGRSAIQVHVSRLRGRLEPHGVTVARCGDGYMVDAERSTVDVHRFSAAVARADRLATASARADSLAAALAMWHAPLMCDEADDRLRDRVGRGLAELRLSAVERWARAELDRGRPDLATAGLRDIVQDHPTHEGLVALLVRALTNQGQRAEAAEVFHTTRQRLAKELGIDPGAELTTEYQRTLRAPWAADTGGPGPVRAALATAYAGLDTDAERLLRMLAVAPLRDAVPGCAGSMAGVGTARAKRLLDRLAGMDLVVQSRAGRYACPDTVRAFVSAQHAGDTTAALDRLYDWYLARADAVCERLYPTFLRPPVPSSGTTQFNTDRAAQDWLLAERPNLVTLACTGHPAVRLLAPVLRGYFCIRWPVTEWLKVAQAGLKVATAEDDLVARAAGHHNVAHAYLTLGDEDAAIEEFRLAVTDAERAQWWAAAASTLALYGWALARTGHFTEAVDTLRRGIALNRRLERPAGEAVCLSHLGFAYDVSGRPERAVTPYRRAVALQRALRAPTSLANVLCDLGWLYRKLGRDCEAAMCAAEAIAGYTAVDAPRWEARAHRLLAEIASDRAEPGPRDRHRALAASLSHRANH